MRKDGKPEKLKQKYPEGGKRLNRKCPEGKNRNRNARKRGKTDQEMPRREKDSRRTGGSGAGAGIFFCLSGLRRRDAARDQRAEMSFLTWSIRPDM